MAHQKFGVTTQITSTCACVQFIRRRTTVVGIQYTAADQHIITVNGGQSSCSCGMEKYSVTCKHRLAAQAEEKAYADEAAVRSTYCIEFAIY